MGKTKWRRSLPGSVAYRIFWAGSLCLSCMWAQTLTVAPARVLRDQTATIRATVLQPNAPVTLKADLMDGEGQHWISEAEFVADSQGQLDLSRQAPEKGSYQGVSAMGLIWSMRPAEKGVIQYRAPKDFGPQSVRFQLVTGGSVVATAQLEQNAIADGIKQIKIEGQLHGILFLPTTPGPHPGLLVLGGSEGGLPSRRAALLASHGYAALALAYFRYENSPKELEAIPLEYFGQALGWMAHRPEIFPNQIGVVGVSRGGELALQLGSMFPSVKAVVAYVPANVRYRACCGNGLFPYAWTWKGEPLAFIGRDPHGTEALQAAIRVENINGPLLLIGGEDDHVWDSAGMVRQIALRLKKEHFSHEVQTLIYEHAGHMAGRPDLLPEWHGPLRHPVSGRSTNPGGTPEGNARSSLDAIPKVLDFLQRNLPGSL